MDLFFTHDRNPGVKWINLRTVGRLLEGNKRRKKSSEGIEGTQFS
jgi:hypothetical protein